MALFRSKAEQKVLDAGYDPARLPPGQYLTEKWPVLHAGSVPSTDLARWDLRVFGEVESELRLTWDELRALPASETTQDPRGPIKLDEYGNPTENVYIVRVEKVGGRLQNTVIHTYPMVSQFWTYRPDEFLKTPAYDRSYPPVKP